MNGTGGPPPVPFGVLDAVMSAIDADYIAGDDEWDELVWVCEFPVD